MLSTVIERFFPKVPPPNGSRCRANKRVIKKSNRAKHSKSLNDLKVATADAIETLGENDEDIRDSIHQVLIQLRKAKIDRALLMIGLAAILIEIEHSDGSVFWSAIKSLFGG